MSEKKVVTFEGDDLKVITFGGKKYRVTPLVIAPGDINVSDATAPCV